MFNLLANVNGYEVVSFVLYFAVVLGIGVWFFVKSRDKGEKDYFLGGRNMNGFVSALSAGASDMSAWCLMGLPGAIYLSGLGQVWISIGLVIGTFLAWIFVAPKLRRYSIKAGDAITVPQYLQNRFKESNPSLRIASAIIFVIAYCIYSASSIKACGSIFSSIMGIDQTLAMIISAGVIVIYTLLGGFSAVCWTDFVQGMLMLFALMLVPIVACGVIGNGVYSVDPLPANYYNFLSSGKFDWASAASIITGLGWGLGYAGMPHILVRYMAIKDEKEMRRSQKLGCFWTFMILLMTTVMALIARKYFGRLYEGGGNEMIFVYLIRSMMSWGAVALIGGLMLSAIVAAAMSTADSQLLASSSSFSSDIYKTVIRKNADDKELLWVGRIGVLIVTVVALIIAVFAGGSSIMSLVSAAWSIFGAAFGPAIILSLYWKRFNYKGAVFGIISGFTVSVLWMILFNFEYYGFSSVVFNTQIYEIVPGFIVGLAVAVIVSLLTKAPAKEVTDLFDEVTEEGKALKKK